MTLVVEHTTEPKADGRLMEQSVYWYVWRVRTNSGDHNRTDIAPYHRIAYGKVLPRERAIANTLLYRTDLQLPYSY